MTRLPQGPTKISVAEPTVVRLTSFLPRVEHLWQRSMVYQLAKDGRLPGVYLRAGTWMVNVSTFEAWLHGDDQRSPASAAMVAIPAVKPSAIPPGEKHSKALDRYLRSLPARDAYGFWTDAGPEALPPKPPQPDILRALADWAECQHREMPVEQVRMWLTEAYARSPHGTL